MIEKHFKNEVNFLFTERFYRQINQMLAVLYLDIQSKVYFRQNRTV